MWGPLLIGFGIYGVWRGLTAKEFYIRGEGGAGPEWKSPAWLGRLVHFVVGGIAIWKGISLLLG